MKDDALFDPVVFSEDPPEQTGHNGSFFEESLVDLLIPSTLERLESLTSCSTNLLERHKRHRNDRPNAAKAGVKGTKAAAKGTKAAANPAKAAANPAKAAANPAKAASKSSSKKQQLKKAIKRQRKGKTTLWDLILLNQRTLSQEEIAEREAKKRAEQETRKKNQNRANDLDDLFGSTDEPTELMLTANTSSTDNLFDDFSSGITSTVKFDGAGGLMAAEDEPTGPIDLFAEGREIISEDYSITAPIEPYKEAYKVGRRTKWSEEDEATFYRGISIFGLDLMMVNALLPHMTEKQIKDKFKVESRKGDKIDRALSERRKISVEDFEKIHGKIDASTHYREDSLVMLSDGLLFAEDTVAGVESLFEET